MSIRETLELFCFLDELGGTREDSQTTVLGRGAGRDEPVCLGWEGKG